MKIAEIQSRIRELKKEKNAIVLAHNYQTTEIFEIADALGDSFDLAVAAQKTDAEIIVFAGVKFMAESAKILNPAKKILLPEISAGCPLADFATVEKVHELKKKFPDAAVAAYVNSSAAVKAESDICVTSANAIKICRKLKENKIIFLPDRNLGEWIAENLPEKKIILWKGFCEVHSKVLKTEILTKWQNHPAAKLLVHPECRQAVRALADMVVGTGGMLNFVEKSDATEFLIATENGMLDRLQLEFPNRKFIAVAGKCVEMKKISLEKILNSLENETGEVEVAPEIANPARRGLEKMVELTTK